MDEVFEVERRTFYPPNRPAEPVSRRITSMAPEPRPPQFTPMTARRQVKSLPMPGFARRTEGRQKGEEEIGSLSNCFHWKQFRTTSGYCGWRRVLSDNGTRRTYAL